MEVLLPSPHLSYLPATTSSPSLSLLLSSLHSIVPQLSLNLLPTATSIPHILTFLFLSLSLPSEKEKNLYSISSLSDRQGGVDAAASFSHLSFFLSAFHNFPTFPYIHIHEILFLFLPSLFFFCLLPYTFPLISPPEEGEEGRMRQGMSPALPLCLFPGIFSLFFLACMPSHLIISHSHLQHLIHADLGEEPTAGACSIASPLCVCGCTTNDACICTRAFSCLSPSVSLSLFSFYLPSRRTGEQAN